MLQEVDTDLTPKSGIHLSKLNFNDGSSVDLDVNSILVLTGANNCGKSQCLRDIAYNIFAKREYPIVLKSVEHKINGPMSDIIEIYTKDKRELTSHQSVRNWIVERQKKFEEDATVLLKEGQNLDTSDFHEILKFYLNFMNTASRLLGFGFTDFYSDDSDKFYTTSISLRDMFESLSLEQKFYDTVAGSFGKGALLNRACFGMTRLHYVDQVAVQNRNDYGKPSFAHWFSKQPRLDQQGDGVNAFCNILLNMLCNKRCLILLDEPEAFLHPPQVRALANVIANESGSDTQIIISTHSHDLVQGLIDFAPGRTSVVRMMRDTSVDPEINVVRRLNSDDIKNLWHDPLLRVSDALSSLFHHAALIVEGDSDARFFRTMIDTLRGETDKLLDIRFIHCGGKDRIPKIARALRAIGVPIVVIVDIDILDDQNKFLELIGSLGGDVDKFRQALKLLSAYIADQKTIDTAGDAKENLLKIFDGIESRKPISKDKLALMHDILRSSSAWSSIKRSGEAFFRRGEPYNQLQSILRLSKDIGLIINHHGELENLCKTVEARKSEWLAAVLEKDLLRDNDLREARDFTYDILEKCKIVSGIGIDTKTPSPSGA